MKAFLKNYRQSPRKVRLVADLLVGKSAPRALLELDFLPKRASLPIKKLLNSAISNAKQFGFEAENLIIKELRVDKGIVMKRMRARAMGRGARINKRTSHVALLLAEKNEKTKNKNRKANTPKNEVKAEVKLAKPKKLTKEKLTNKKQKASK